MSQAQPVILAEPARPAAAFVKALGTNKTALFGLVVFALIIAAAIAAPLISPHDPFEQSILARLREPSAANWLGTDQYGRDVLSRILWGARITLFICLTSVLIGMAVGGAIGLLSGYIGGIFDALTMQVMNVLLSFPTLIMGLMVAAVLGPSVPNLIFAIALTVIAPFARIARAPTLVVIQRDFVEAARALGFSHWRIILKHVFPNIVTEVLVMGSLWLATAVRVEASLSFIGLGVKPPTPTWGGMIRDGFENILDAPWLVVFPSIAVLALVFALNMLGDGFRDAIDPKLRNTE